MMETSIGWDSEEVKLRVLKMLAQKARSLVVLKNRGVIEDLEKAPIEGPLVYDDVDSCGVMGLYYDFGNGCVVEYKEVDGEPMAVIGRFYYFNRWFPGAFNPKNPRHQYNFIKNLQQYIIHHENSLVNEDIERV